jgi:hypothetical protein
MVKPISTDGDRIFTVSVYFGQKMLPVFVDGQGETLLSAEDDNVYDTASARVSV